MSHKSIEKERDMADAHREGLIMTLSELFSSRAPDHASHDATTQVANIARSVVSHGIQGAKDRPAALALIGIGAAMLFAQNGKGHQTQGASSSEDSDVQEATIAGANKRLKEQVAKDPDLYGHGHSAETLRLKLDEGLHKLAPEGKARIRAARLKAVAAQEAVESQAKRLGETVHRSHQSHPLMTALACAGLGALVGALLPSTKRETALMGAKRDQFMREAEHALRHEIGELERKGKAAVSAGMTAVRDELGGAQHG